jgi:general secretion pathway protein G
MYAEEVAYPSRARVRRRIWLLLLCVALVFAVTSRLAARNRRESRDLTRGRMAEIEKALDRYAIDNGGMIPTTQQGLRALVQCPAEEPVPRNWRGPYLGQSSSIFDGWGRKLHYVSPGGGHPARPYDLWSLGRDDIEGGSGANADINSWQPETLSP